MKAQNSELKAQNKFQNPSSKDAAPLGKDSVWQAGWNFDDLPLELLLNFELGAS
jgi:hypothetical protein